MASPKHSKCGSQKVSANGIGQAEIPQLIRPYLNAAYVALLQPYADASEGRRLCWKICLLNTGIWLMWQFQRLQPMMNRAFVHQPLSGLTYTLLSSTFSHSSLLHLAFNCLALEGFGSAATTYLRQAQDKNVPGQLESTKKLTISSSN
ncbi:Presenilins-associated rhomboid-like mitochondrial [Lentinula edodes]|uniref:Presenilins-associated rhomboid-like mitochondrial n=1 Tax=Lentinula edodes TaxID=5353 RepID=A0A1Q3EDH3_LENED|nr:Presenilins-associated rhomboid-like mitochondrial [Lentinula edodes]